MRGFLGAEFRGAYRDDPAGARRVRPGHQPGRTSIGKQVFHAGRQRRADFHAMRYERQVRDCSDTEPSGAADEAGRHSQTPFRLKQQCALARAAPLSLSSRCRRVPQRAATASGAVSPPNQGRWCATPLLRCGGASDAQRSSGSGSRFVPCCGNSAAEVRRRCG